MTPVKQFLLPSGRGTWGLSVEGGVLVLSELTDGEWRTLASFPVPRERIEAFIRDVVVPKLNELLARRIAADRSAELALRLPAAINLTDAGFDYQRPPR
jgi:hypothetical protein